MKTASLFFLVILPLSLVAQMPDTLWTTTFPIPFVSTHTPEYRIRQCRDSTFVVVINDSMFVKLGQNGDSLWSRSYRATITGIDTTINGGYVLSGVRGSRAWVALTNSIGDTLWTREFTTTPTVSPCKVISLHDGNLIVYGRDAYPGYWFWKFDSLGNPIQRDHYIPGQTSPYFKAIETHNYNIAVAVLSRHPSTEGGSDFRLVLYNRDGSTAWGHTYHSPGPDVMTSLCETADHGFLMCGYSDGDVLVIKADENGDSLWSRRLGSFQTEAATDVLEVADGNLWLAGYSNTWANDYWLACLSNAGDSLWSRSIGVDLWNECSSISSTFDGGCILSGRSYVRQPTRCFLWVVKTDPENFMNTPSIAQTLPNSISLSAYPNPFNPATTLEFSLSRRERVTIDVFDLQGRLARSVLAEVRESGVHRVPFDGAGLPSGIYFARLTTPEFVRTQKIVLLK